MVKIRFAKAKDIPFLADVERSAAKAFQALPNHISSDRTVDVAALEKMAAAQKLWVAEMSQGIIAGFLGCEDKGKFLYVHEISVAHEFQKQGIGRRLMTTILDEAGRLGYSAVGLTTRRDAVWNAPFYESLGFHYLLDGQEWPSLFEQLQKEIAQGANPSIRCAMIKET